MHIRHCVAGAGARAVVAVILEDNGVVVEVVDVSSQLRADLEANAHVSQQIVVEAVKKNIVRQIERDTRQLHQVYKVRE